MYNFILFYIIVYVICINKSINTVGSIQFLKGGTNVLQAYLTEENKPIALLAHSFPLNIYSTIQFANSVLPALVHCHFQIVKPNLDSIILYNFFCIILNTFPTTRKPGFATHMLEKRFPSSQHLPTWDNKSYFFCKNVYKKVHNIGTVIILNQNSQGAVRVERRSIYIVY